jgi:hypothetical protein
MVQRHYDGLPDVHNCSDGVDNPSGRPSQFCATFEVFFRCSAVHFGSNNGTIMARIATAATAKLIRCDSHLRLAMGR